MNRGMWFLAGTAAGVYGMARVRRMADVLTVDGLHDRLSGLFAGARVFSEEVRAGMAEKEAELSARVAQAAGPPQLPTAGRAAPGSDPAAGPRPAPPRARTGSDH